MSDWNEGATRRLNLEGPASTSTPPPGIMSPEIRSPSRGGVGTATYANSGTVRKMALPAPVSNAHQMKHFQQLKSEAQAWEQKYKTAARENIEKEAKMKEMQETISKLETSKAAAIKAKVEGEQNTLRHKSVETRNRELNERIEGIRAAAAEREGELTRHAQDCEQAANKWKAYGEDAYRRVEEIRVAYTQLEHVCRAAQEDLAKLQKQHTDATKELRITKDDLNRTTQRANELTEANAKLLGELHAADAAVKEVTSARQRDETHLFQMHEAEQKMRDRIADALEQARKADERYQEMEAALETEKRRTSQLEDRIAAMQVAVERVEDDKLQLAAKLEESARDNQRLKMNVDTSSTSSKHLQMLIDQTKASEQATIAKFKQLSEDATERAKEFTQLKMEHNQALVTIRLKEHDISLLQAEVVSSRHEAEVAKTAADAIRRENAEVSTDAASKLLSVTHERRVLEEQLAGLEQRLAMATADNNRLKLEADQYKCLADEAQRRTEDALSSAGSTMESFKDVVAARHKAENEAAKKAAALHELEGRLAQLQHCLNETSAALADNTTKLDNERQAKQHLDTQVAELQGRLALQVEAAQHISMAKEEAAAAAATAIAALQAELAESQRRAEAALQNATEQRATLNRFILDELKLEHAIDAEVTVALDAFRAALEAKANLSASHEATSAKLKAALVDLDSARCNIERLERCLVAASSDATTSGRRAMSLENMLNTTTQRTALEMETLASELQSERQKVEQLRKELMMARQQLVEGREDAMNRFETMQEEVVRARSESAAAGAKAKAIRLEVDSELDAERTRRATLEAALERSETALGEQKKQTAHEASRHKAYKEALEAVKAKLSKSQECRQVESERFREKYDRLMEHRDQSFRDFEELAKNYKELAAAFRTRGGDIMRDLGAEHSTRVSQCILTTERNKKAAVVQQAMLQEQEQPEVAASFKGKRREETDAAPASDDTTVAYRESNVLGMLPSNGRADATGRKSVSFDPRPARRIESADRPDEAAELAPVLKRNRAEVPLADDRYAR